MLIAVDTGGTKTLVASFSSDGLIQQSQKFPTPRDKTEYIKQLSDTIRNILGSKPATAIVVAFPGIVKNDVAIWCPNIGTGWTNFNAVKPLQAAFPNVPILVENDANLAGLAETRSLFPLPTSSLYVTISTGIGLGMITEGKIDPGLRYSEGGHVMIEFNGEVREWESFASGKAVYELYGKFARDITDKKAWRQIADRISRGFLAVIPIIQPEVIIIGGSIGTYLDRYSEPLDNILKEKLPSHIASPKIIQASHPEEAVIYGCYYYALDNLTDISP